MNRSNALTVAAVARKKPYAHIRIVRLLAALGLIKPKTSYDAQHKPLKGRWPIMEPREHTANYHTRKLFHVMLFLGLCSGAACDTMDRILDHRLEILEYERRRGLIRSLGGVY